MTCHSAPFLSRLGRVSWLLFCGAFLLAVSARGADTAKRAFDLPTDTADKSLRKFSLQSGYEVLFATQIAARVQANAVQGELTPQDAVNRLLVGTGLAATQDARTGAFTITRVSDPNVQRAAQTTPSDRPNQNREAAPSAEEKTIELSPFVVNADQDVGYLAGNTLAGSRLNTPLKDTAASISVLTEEFLKDIAATNLTEALEYSNNSQFERDDAGSFGDSPAGNPTFFNFDSYRVRGQSATVARNYFPWALPTDTYNIGRVEETRGPNSILFGLGSAGGLISAATKQADTNRSFRRGTLSTDEFGSYRGTIDLNHALLGGKLGFRVNAVTGRGETFRHHSFSEPKRIHLAATYKVFERTRIRAEYETGKIDENVQRVGALYDAVTSWIQQGRPTYDPPIASNTALQITNLGATRRVTYFGNETRLLDMANTDATTTTNIQIIDRKLYDASISTGGPGQLRNVSFNAPSVFVEQQLAKNIFLEVAYNHQDFRSKAYQAAGDSTYLRGDANRRLPGGAVNPHAGQFYIEGPTWTWLRNERADNTRATLSLEHNFGKWGNYRLAGLAEYEARKIGVNRGIEVWAGAPFSATPEAAANNVWRRSYVTEGSWGTYYIHGPGQTGLIQNMVDPISGRTLSSTFVQADSAVSNDPIKQKTLLIGGQARYFGGRLVAGFGFRHDKVHTLDRAELRNPLTQEWEEDWTRGVTYDDTGRTRTLGLVGHVTSYLALMYNQSSNFGLPTRGAFIVPEDRLAPNPEGKGEDVGFSLTLFEGKLYARATYYETEQQRATVGGFGGTNTAPSSVSSGVLGALLSAGVINQATYDAHLSRGNQALGDRSSRGYEFSLTGNVTKNWRLQMNYSITDGALENIALEVADWWETEKVYYRSFNRGGLVTNLANRTIDQAITFFDDNYAVRKSGEGVGLVGNRRHKANVFTRYTFSSGPLKNLYVGGGYRHQSKMLIGKNSDNSPRYGNSYGLADALIGYRIPKVPLFKRLNLQLNVSNLFDENEPLITRQDANVTYRFAMQTPRNWRLTADFEF